MPGKRKSATLLVGAGRMGGALLNGWVNSGLNPIIAIEPVPSPKLKKFAGEHGIELVDHVDRVVVAAVRTCVVALKPQVLRTEAAALRAIPQKGALMLSIAAGTSMAQLKLAWGRRAHIVRAMPNTPGAIGYGVTALYAPRNISLAERKRAHALVAGLGEVVWVNSEDDIDAVTAVSGSGPAYVFLLTEALARAGENIGLSPAVAGQLARATVVGSGMLLAKDARPPSELRHDVTSPGGTTEAASKVLMAEDGLEALLRRAVAAARQRAVGLRS